MNKKSPGFSLPIAIVALLVIGALGFIGWRLYDANRSNQHPQSEVTANQQQVGPNEGYVVIKEWGVRFKPANGVGTVIYGALPAATVPYATEELALPDGSIKIVISTKELAERGSDCGVEKNTTTPWTIYRSPQPLNVAQGVTLGKVGDYYYYYFGAQAACVDRQEDLELNTKTSTLLLSSIKTLELAK